MTAEGVRALSCLKTAMRALQGNASLRLLEGFMPGLESSAGWREAASTGVRLPRAGHGRPAPFFPPLPAATPFAFLGPPLPPLGLPVGVTALVPLVSLPPLLLAPPTCPSRVAGWGQLLSSGPWSLLYPCALPSPFLPPSQGRPLPSLGLPSPAPSLPTPQAAGRDARSCSCRTSV